MNPKRIFAAALFLICGTIPVRAEVKKIESCDIQVGTIEMTENPMGFIFEAGGKRELYGANFGSSKAKEFEEIPGLREVGFKLSSGEEFVDPKKPIQALWVEARRAHPGKAVIERIFEGGAGMRIGIPMKGRIGVVRVKLRIGEQEVTLWKQVER